MAEGKKGSLLDQTEEMLELYMYKKAPALPVNVRELLAKLTPWANVVSIVLGILALPVLLAALGLGAILAPVAGFGGYGGVQYSVMWWASTLLLLPVLVLEIMAAKGLFAMQAKAWKYIFYAQLVSAVASLLTLSLMGVVWAAAFVYILFQVRSHFNK